MKPGCYLETGQIRCTGAFVGLLSMKLIKCVYVDYKKPGIAYDNVWRLYLSDMLYLGRKVYSFLSVVLAKITGLRNS